MSLPEIDPKTTAAGISVDPRTLERVIPETKRADGTFRKQLRVRPGFTPQEDVSRFRGSRQQQMDRNALPKGHILGWVAPSSEANKAKKNVTGSGIVAGGGPIVNSTTGEPLSKAAAKNAKRRAKKREQEVVDGAVSVEKEKEKQYESVKDNWEDSDGEKEGGGGQSKAEDAATNAPAAEEANGDSLAREIKNLDIR